MNLHRDTPTILRDQDYDRISLALDQQLVAEEAALHTVKESLHRLEEEMFKRLWRMGAGSVRCDETKIN